MMSASCCEKVIDTAQETGGRDSLQEDDFTVCHA